MNPQPAPVPGWLQFLGTTTVALVAVGGMVALLILRIPVPGEQWGLVSVIGRANYGVTPFQQVVARNQATERSLIELNHHHVQLTESMVARDAMSTKTTVTGSTAGAS